MNQCVVRGAVCGVLLLVSLPVAAQQNYYRPLHLQDMVKAVGTNTEGMPPEELPKRISTYALHIGDDNGVGVSVRFAEDPDGAILVGWRTANAVLWRYGWVDEPGLGRLEAYRPVGDHFVVETLHPDRRMTSVLLRPDFSTLAVLDGRVESVVTDAASKVVTVGVVSGTARRTLTCRPGIRCS